MPDDNNPNYALLLEKIASLETKCSNLESKLQEVTEFNRQLLARNKPEQPSQQDADDVKAAKEKLEKFLEV